MPAPAPAPESALFVPRPARERARARAREWSLQLAQKHDAMRAMQRDINTAERHRDSLRYSREKDFRLVLRAFRAANEERFAEAAPPRFVERLALVFLPLLDEAIS